MRTRGGRPNRWAAVGELFAALAVLALLAVAVWAEWLIITGHENAGDTFERIWGGVIYAFLGLGALVGLFQLATGSSGRENGHGHEVGFTPDDDDPID
ncbi:hypothetical protein ACSNOI_39460 [Actinomadura kijaniata]|uniref:hypothetical protein n=1 Tax=Actinomadura kijaniata TaxID=46161 RepID=UPI003F1E3D1D